MVLGIFDVCCEVCFECILNAGVFFGVFSIVLPWYPLYWVEYWADGIIGQEPVSTDHG